MIDTKKRRAARKGLFCWMVVSIWLLGITQPAYADTEYGIKWLDDTDYAVSVEESTEAVQEISPEEAYQIREQYIRDIQLENAYAARMNYTSERAQSMVSELMDTGSDIVQYALQWVGVTPYVWAGGSLWYGTDCSGFVHLIFQQFGYYLPTGSDAYQYSVGRHVSYDELKPGDIIVYGYGAHVGIYAGNDLVVHCSSPENGTVCWNMWYREPTAFVRVVE